MDKITNQIIIDQRLYIEAKRKVRDRHEYIHNSTVEDRSYQKLALQEDIRDLKVKSDKLLKHQWLVEATLDLELARYGCNLPVKLKQALIASFKLKSAGVASNVILQYTGEIPTGIKHSIKTRIKFAILNLLNKW